MVHGKSRDDKEPIDLHPNMTALLRDYLNWSDIRSGWLFPSPRKGRPLSSNMIWRIVMAVHKAACVESNVHGYRKTFTSKLIDSRLNLLEVKQFTRHRDTAQLETYYNRLDKQKTLPTYYRTFDSHGCIVMNG